MGIADVLGLAGTVAENWREANDARRTSYLYELQREQAARLDALRQLELQQDVYGNAPPDIGAVNYAPGQDFIEVAQQQQMMQNALANAGVPTAVPLAPLQQGTPQVAALSSLERGKPDYGAGTYAVPPAINMDDPRVAKAAMDTVAAVDAKQGVQDIMASGRPSSFLEMGSMYARGVTPEARLSQGQQDTIGEANNALRQLNESEYFQAMRDIDAYQRQFNAGASPATLRRNGSRAKYEAAVETLNRLNAPAAQSDGGEKPAKLPVAYPAPQDTQQAAQDPLAAVVQMINGGQPAAPAPAQVQAPAAAQYPAGTDFVAPIFLKESGNRHFNDNGQVKRGVPVPSHGGDRAVGAGQIMPGTAMSPGGGIPNVFQVADQLGVPYSGTTKADGEKLLENEAVNRTLARAKFTADMQYFGGNPLLAAAAYVSGRGNAEKWAKSGDFNALPPEARDYVVDYAAKLAAMTGSQAYPNMPAPVPGVEQVSPSIAEQSPIVQMDRSQFYLANPASVPRDLQVLPPLHGLCCLCERI